MFCTSLGSPLFAVRRVFFRFGIGVHAFSRLDIRYLYADLFSGLPTAHNGDLCRPRLLTLGHPANLVVCFRPVFNNIERDFLPGDRRLEVGLKTVRASDVDF